jgi:hypothetical protein
MDNGAFTGNHSVCDGLASCYMGNNRYLFFTVTDSYESTSSTRGLKAYIIDMNENNGKGKRTSFEQTVESASVGMSESLELIPQAGTTDKYWLVYACCSGSCSNTASNILRVRSVDVSNAVNPVGGVHQDIATSTRTYAYTMKASRLYNRIGVAYGVVGGVDVFDFNNSTGLLSNQRSVSGINGTPYGLEFSPDGNQVYVAGYRGSNAVISQYSISGSLVHVSNVKYWTQTVEDSKGGGLKLGPDDKIYVIQYNSNMVGAISSPNLTTSLSSRYNHTAMTLSVTHTGLQFSTGLTKPAVMSCNMNIPPETQPDDTTFCVSSISRTAKVNVLKNDADADDNKIYLTNATFVNSADAALATLTVNAADSTITLTIKPDVTINAEHVFEIIYDVKDNGLLASQCATGMLRVTVNPTPVYPDLRLRVCPDAGNINLAKYIDTTDNVKYIQWAGQIPSMILSDGTVLTNNLTSARVLTFTYTITSQCVADQKRKVYLEVIKNGNVRRQRDTITICHKYADAVQINQIFGIESGNGDKWSYHAVKPESDGGGTASIDAHVAESTSSSIHAGARVMNGKAIYEDGSIPYNSYHELNNVKIVKITYKSDDDTCLEGREYTRVIVLTGS